MLLYKAKLIMLVKLYSYHQIATGTDFIYYVIVNLFIKVHFCLQGGAQCLVY